MRLTYSAGEAFWMIYSIFRDTENFSINNSSAFVALPKLLLKEYLIATTWFNLNTLSSSILQIIQYSFKTSNIVHLVIFFTNNFLTIDSIVWALDYFSTIMAVLLIFLK